MAMTKPPSFPPPRQLPLIFSFIHGSAGRWYDSLLQSRVQLEQQRRRRLQGCDTSRATNALLAQLVPSFGLPLISEGSIILHAEIALGKKISGTVPAR
ncbi:hypothetical protein ACP70R_037986 [Stipagrostis hirtigluma subsp. patula]